MFPPPFSRESILSDDVNPLTQAYRDVVVYDEREADVPLYQGPIVVHANGWIELEGDRLLSPNAVHHIDIYDGDAGLDDQQDTTGRADTRTGDDSDDHRTGRFSR
ncbi:hypothetical protein [Natrinema ejinorense]|uniref:Uncharacterized protein n=1 Tax=Natrinema ejinorense TaxID=373386 RepID=A0A2A5QUJ7_9EURY|nr:hypothetical protein [Natrinema ejinorense]PCR90510.1 hypothetical protein CP557_08250 [Natrinema ejinorense]